MFKKRLLVFILTPLVAFLSVGIFAWARGDTDFMGIGGANSAWYMERIENETDLKKQQTLMRTLAKQVGPKKAIELLNESTLAKAGPSHLLAHTIGETAYELYGEDSLAYCPEDVRSGCSHGLFTVAIADIGMEGVQRMIDRCRGLSPFQYSMCIHAAGHAFTALSGYDVFRALDMCEGLVAGDPYASRCYSGVFMENAHGVHDGFIPPLHPYLSFQDLLLPCNAVDVKYRRACYSNQAGWWYADVFGRDVTKTVANCANVPEEYYLACLDNVARVISAHVENDPGGIDENCRLFDAPFNDECIASIAESVFIQGDRDLPFTLCHMITESTVKRSCYERLSQEFTLFALTPDVRSTLCEKFEPAFLDVCQKQ